MICDIRKNSHKLNKQTNLEKQFKFQTSEIIKRNLFCETETLSTKTNDKTIFLQNIK